MIVTKLSGVFHLFNKSDKEIRELSKDILMTGIDYVCTGHCTKDRAYKIMKEELGARLTLVKIGLEMVF